MISVFEIFDSQAFLTKFTDQILPEYLHKQRWFGAKLTKVKRYDPRIDLKYILPNGEACILLVVETVLYTATTESYFLPIKLSNVLSHPNALIYDFQDNAKGYLIDALYDENFREGIFKHMLHNKESKLKNGYLKFEKGSSSSILNYNHSQLLHLEQSNSTIIYNDSYFLKVFRKLFRDTNPDLELTRFLSSKSDFNNAPQYAGSISYCRPEMPDVSLALMQNKIENKGDAWHFFLEKVDAFFKKIIKTITSFTSNKTENIAKVESLFEIDNFKKIELLAQRTAEMHIALFSDKEDKSFSPSEFTADYKVWLLNRLIYQFDIRMNLLEMNFEKLNTKAKEVAKKIIGKNDKIKNIILNFNEDKLNSKRIRIHGDYHLGQILMTNDDFIIIDFEGEPESTIRDRKVKQPPIKDVAGMLRSFDYAIHACIFNNQYQAKEELLFEAGKILLQHIQQRFLNTYKQIAIDAGLDIGYEKEIQFLLNYHLLEKAIYEIGYELNSRPDWVLIPLSGIIDILENQKT
jgi:maltose alpha-D-glucosyltransferase/alpha-amylase